MQTTIDDRNLFIKTKNEQPVLLKRTIIEVVTNHQPKVVKNQNLHLHKIKYPTNGLYGLL